MTWIRQIRRGAVVGAVALAVLGATAASASGATLKLKTPGVINHNKHGHLTASGDTAGGKDYLIVVFQHTGCRGNYAADADAASSSANGVLISKKVGPGKFKRKAPVFGGVKGSSTYCAYLYGPNQSWGSAPLAKAQGFVTFT